MHFLLIGLGNPEPGYSNTRHNIGFEFVNNVAKKYLFPAFTLKHDTYYSQGQVDDKKITLIKPYNYMNNSGNNLPIFIKKFTPNCIVVVHDDIDLEISRVKIKFSGGNAGHNGLKSIDAHIGKDYWRVRIGVGRPENPNISIADFVLGRFNTKDKELIDSIIDKLSEDITGLLNGFDVH